jgi:predicted aminopeptidase
LSLLTGCYSLRQAWHQNNLFNSRRPIVDVIADPSTDPKLVDKLKLTISILDYAKTQGLNTEDAYTYYIETGKKRVSYLVQAAKADELESVTWWFPFVGSVPYLGFFEESDRDAKAKELAEEGYDIYTTGVGAFSSLGWFSDPVFTSMLKRPRPSLASLYFHELTHRTFWISGSVKFNENLAEYVADVLTPMYLRDSGHQDKIKTYLDRKKDRRLFKNWLKKLRRELKKLYSQKSKMEPSKLLASKAAIFSSFVIDKKPNFATADYIGRGDKEWNNARVLGASLYEPDLPRFAKAHACAGDLSIIQFLALLDDRAEDFDDPFEALDSFCLQDS